MPMSPRLYVLFSTFQAYWAITKLTQSGLDICVTIAPARKRGAASMSLQWGINKADEMDVEAFVEATVDGAQLYERFGFDTKQLVTLNGENVRTDAEWGKLTEEYPLKYRWMEREKKSARF